MLTLTDGTCYVGLRWLHLAHEARRCNFSSCLQVSDRCSDRLLWLMSWNLTAGDTGSGFSSLTGSLLWLHGLCHARWSVAILFHSGVTQRLRLSAKFGVEQMTSQESNIGKTAPKKHSMKRYMQDVTINEKAVSVVSVTHLHSPVARSHVDELCERSCGSSRKSQKQRE